MAAYDRTKYYAVGEIKGIGPVQYIGRILGELDTEDVFFRIDTVVFERNDPHFGGSVTRLLDEPVHTVIKRTALLPHDA